MKNTTTNNQTHNTDEWGGKSPRTIDPGKSLLERIQMGFTVPDQELYRRAHNFVAWAPYHPFLAARYLARMRRRDYPTIALWEAVRPIVDPISALLGH